MLTSCFDDSILEPLGCWVFILGTLILLAVFWRRRTGDVNYLGMCVQDMADACRP